MKKMVWKVVEWEPWYYDLFCRDRTEEVRRVRDRREITAATFQPLKSIRQATYSRMWSVATTKMANYSNYLDFFSFIKLAVVWKDMTSLLFQTVKQ